MKKIIKYLNETIKKEKNILIFILITFFLGLILGSLFINFITEDDKKLLVEQLELFLSNVKNLTKDVFGIKVFSGEILNNGFQLFIIFVLGISMIGLPVVIIIMFFKGFMLGTTLATIILKYQFKGIIGSFLYVFPCYIFNIIIYIFISFFAVHASIKFLKALFKKDNLNFKSFFGRYLLSFIISMFLMIIVCLLDAYLTPVLLKLFTYII